MNAVLTEVSDHVAAHPADRFADIYVWETGSPAHDASTAFSYVGNAATPVPSLGLQPWLEGLLTHVYAKHAGAEDFAVAREIEGSTFLFRGHRDTSVAGGLLALRRIPSVAPRLEELKLPMYWRELFMLPEYCHQGGLILLAAQTGQGKSTTLAAIVKSRLEQFGGYCRAIEDPPELPIHGTHGPGVCVQTPVDPNDPDFGFSRALRSALRSYPTGVPTICLIGEIRDSDTAVQALRASVNGHLVLTTVHASDCASALTRVLAMADRGLGEKAARDLLSSGLRMVIHQRLMFLPERAGWSRGAVTGQILFSRGTDSPVANAIRRSEVASALAEPVRAQQTHLGRAGYNVRDLVQKLSG